MSIVSTMYRSASYLREFYHRTVAAVSPFSRELEFIFVDDGSPDNSIEIARSFLSDDHSVTIVRLSRNYGHHRAIMVGLEHAGGDLVFLIDCDLEEQPEMFPDMYERIQNSAKPVDVVYAVPKRRKGSVFERMAGAMFYTLFNSLSDVRVPANAMVARLMTQRYVKALLAHQERVVFLGGLFSLAGFEQASIIAEKKHKGSTAWTLRRKLVLAIQSVAGFSAKPLWLLASLGMIALFLSTSAVVYLLARVLLQNADYSGGSISIVVAIAFFGSLNLFAIGILGLYISQVFLEVKQRPCVIQELITNNPKPDSTT